MTQKTIICSFFFQKETKYEVLTPKIDLALDRFRQRGPLSSETDAGEEKRTENPTEVCTTFNTLWILK